MPSRRSLAERVIARASARGVPVDDDAEFMAIVDLWVAGEIEADEIVEEAVSLKLDSDVLAYFQADGPGWQDRINDALRAAVRDDR
jgi:uncharacterized protein (DUF4415 family)